MFYYTFLHVYNPFIKQYYLKEQNALAAEDVLPTQKRSDLEYAAMNLKRYISKISDLLYIKHHKGAV